MVGGLLVADIARYFEAEIPEEAVDFMIDVIERKAYVDLSAEPIRETDEVVLELERIDKAFLTYIHMRMEKENEYYEQGESEKERLHGILTNKLRLVFWLDIWARLKGKITDETNLDLREGLVIVIDKSPRPVNGCDVECSICDRYRTCFHVHKFRREGPLGQA